MTKYEMLRTIADLRAEQEENAERMKQIEAKIDKLLLIFEGKDVPKAVTISATDPIKNQKVVDVEPKVKEAISSYLVRMGMPAHLDGYRFTSRAIELVLGDPSMIKNVTKILYVVIATEGKFKKLENKPEKASKRVERSIRTAIEITWQRGDKQFIQEIFGNSINPERGRPTNSEFIAMIAERIRNDLSQ